MNTIAQQLHYRAQLEEDGRPDSEPIVFRVHVPAGTLVERMSAWELRAFVIDLVHHARPFIADLAKPKILADGTLVRGCPSALWQWDAFTRRLLTWPPEALDECAGWLRPKLRRLQKARHRRLDTKDGAAEEDDIIEFSLDNHPDDVLPGPLYFVGQR